MMKTPINLNSVFGPPPNWKGPIGDKIATIATPIARGLGLPCIDKKTGQLKSDSGCAKRRDKLNQWTTKA